MVSDNTDSCLWRQFGVELVCVADVLNAFGEKERSKLSQKCEVNLYSYLCTCYTTDKDGMFSTNFR